ncbi:hypothetical protein LMH73_018195 [Vibrio splendidus]|nr:hypothetical protein [Vibrio splendidus]MCC4882946.1 hypothetical protein [Vibrio splendidus]
MSTDSVIEFQFNDGTPLCAVYVPSDTHHNEFIPTLQAMFTRIDDDRHEHRLNWDYFVTKIIGEMINTLPKIKILRQDGYDTKYVTYKTIFTPIADAYRTKATAINDSVLICTGYTSKMEEPLYSGLLSGFTEIKESEDD